MFSLFYSVWKNPGMKIHQIIKYLLKHSPQNSRTWAIRIKQLCNLYKLDDPIVYLNKDPLPKSEFKELVLTKITVYYESKLRQEAMNKSKMVYFNVNLFNLRGRYHPVIANATTVSEVQQMRPHLKMLLGDYLTYKVKSEQSGGSPHCRICFNLEPEKPQVDSICHILTFCRSLKDTRKRIISEI